MARTLSERMRDWKWYAEQGLHFLIGSAAAAVMAVGSPILGGVLAALWVAVLREYEQRPVSSWGDLAVDVACTVLGGLVVGLIIWGMA